MTCKQPLSRRCETRCWVPPSPLTFSSLAPVSALRPPTWLMQSPTTGKIRGWSYLLWCTYHLGLRIKLYAKAAFDTEPLFDRIAPGW